MKTKLKIFSVLTLFLIGIIAISGIANADSVPVSIENVYINDKVVEDGEIRGGIVRDDTVEIEVKLLATGDDEYVSIEAEVKGLDHDKEKASDETKVFTVKTGKTYYKDLSITLPDRMDTTQYALRIEISNRQDDKIVYNAILDIDTVRNGVKIKDVVFNPESSIKAGRYLRSNVRVKNIGENEEEDVKVTVRIPELGISDSVYIDELEEEDTVTSKELYVRIPECAEAGEYTATVTVEYDEGDEEISQDYTITVVGSEICNVGDTGKTIVTVGNEVQDVTAGESGVVYPITLSNSGSSAKTYTISAIAGDWANVKVSPSVVVLGAEDTKTVYVSVAANEDASAGEQSFGIAIKSGEKTLKEVTLKANVVESGNAGWDKVKKGLEAGLVILVVLLVIIGLIVGFSRLRGDNEEELSEETYY